MEVFGGGFRWRFSVEVFGGGFRWRFSVEVFGGDIAHTMFVSCSVLPILCASVIAF